MLPANTFKQRRGQPSASGASQGRATHLLVCEATALCNTSSLQAVHNLGRQASLRSRSAFDHKGNLFLTSLLDASRACAMVVDGAYSSSYSEHLMIL